MSKDYFIEYLGSSSSDDEVRGHSEYWTQNRAAQNGSPPAILAFSITSGQGKHRDRNPEPGPSCLVDAEVEEEGENSDWSVEEWMILDEYKTTQEDSTIQLNLSYSNTSPEGDTQSDIGNQGKKTFPQESWAISKSDKESGKVLSTFRYFLPDQSLFCPICKKTGHLAKSCQVKKKGSVCVLCGIQGHLQKDCPRQPCSRCGLLAHGPRVCNRPPLWHQHCQRCGMMGHLSDTCPDTWRQFHHTIKMTEVPVRKRMKRNMKRKKRPAFCYNCSKRGHYGYECCHKRMISGTFFTLPYVCHYDTTIEAYRNASRTQKNTTENTVKTQPLVEQQLCFKPIEEDRNELLQKRTKTKLKAQLGVKKTWPERRRERQEVKRLRREAQARREGGILGQYQHKPDDDILYVDPFGVSNSWKHTSLSKKAKKIASRSQQSRDTKRWKTRGEKTHGLLHPHRDMNMGTKNVNLSKERVRHRRR